MAQCSHTLKHRYVDGHLEPVTCGRLAVCWWKAYEFSKDDPEPRCVEHSVSGYVVAWMRGETQ